MNTTDNNILSLFNDLPFFSLPQTQQQRLFSFGKVRKVPARESLIQEGTTDPVLVVLLEGACQVRKLVPESEFSPLREVTLRRTFAPSIFGEKSFLESRPHSSSVVTTTPCQVWELSFEAFQKFLNGDINLAIYLKRSLSHVVVQRLYESETTLATILAYKDTFYQKYEEISFDDGSPS
ncbi:hypothetical protein NUACC21_48740 [Scytonema sp. NUACC21]